MVGEFHNDLQMALNLPLFLAIAVSCGAPLGRVPHNTIRYCACNSQRITKHYLG